MGYERKAIIKTERQRLYKSQKVATNISITSQYQYNLVRINISKTSKYQYNQVHIPPRRKNVPSPKMTWNRDIHEETHNDSKW